MTEGTKENGFVIPSGLSAGCADCERDEQCRIVRERTVDEAVPALVRGKSPNPSLVPEDASSSW